MKICLALTVVIKCLSIQVLGKSSNGTKSDVPSDMAIQNSYFIYRKIFPDYNGQFLDFHQDLVKKLIHLPANIIHRKQLITLKKYTPKNIHRKNVIQIKTPVLHYI